LFSKVSEEREYERDKKRKKKGKEEIPEGKDNFPEGNKNFPDEFPKEKDTDKIRSNKTRLDKTKQENILPQNPFELLSRKPKNDNDTENNTEKFCHFPNLQNFRAETSKKHPRICVIEAP